MLIFFKLHIHSTVKYRVINSLRAEKLFKKLRRKKIINPSTQSKRKHAIKIIHRHNLIIFLLLPCTFTDKILQWSLNKSSKFFGK